MREENRPPLSSRTVATRLLISNVVYLLIVHGPAFWIGWTQSDFAWDLGPGNQRVFMDAVLGVTGGSLFGLRLFNLVLLWLAMVLIFFLTKQLTRGPWWLGSLAAVLFMAHPLKHADFYRATAFMELYPVLFGLLALLLYAMPAENRWKPALLGVFVWVCAMGVSTSNLPLLLVFVSAELILYPVNMGGLVRAAGLFLVSCVLAAFAPGWDPQAMFLPLFHLIYPIGLLPETAALLTAEPWRFWLGAASVVLFFALLAWLVHRRLFTFALVALVLARVGQGGEAFDPVAMTGGGNLLLPVALGGLAAAALTQAMSRFPKWHRATITYTTLLCLLLFALHIRLGLEWRAESAAYMRDNPGLQLVPPGGRQP